MVTGWEYATIELVHDESRSEWSANFPSGRIVGYTSVLDALGQQSWELVAITPHPLGRSHIAAFKRQLPEQTGRSKNG